MPDQYTYLLVDLCCIVFPFVFSFYPKICFYKQWRYFLLPCLGTGSLFLVWDILFTKAGVWSFNPRYVCGIYLLGLPLEEYLFFLCIPYACVFTYYCMGLFFTFARLDVAATILSWMLIPGLTAAGLTHMPQLYTSITFLLLAAFLLFLLWRRVRFLGRFYVTFFIILIPFFISNGILTGTGLAEPVVRYNDSYNLGIRMLTIPFEDTFYGMLLLLMNVGGVEWLWLKDVSAALSKGTGTGTVE